ncbi:MAG: endonuclease III [Vicinamibacterales bacterium]
MNRLAAATVPLGVPAVERIAETTESDPFQVLIGTLLSARTQDRTTDAACRRLFSVAPDVHSMARLRVDRIQRLIYPVSFYRQKARHLKATCRILIECFGGRVPASMEELLLLPGVGRKTANLVLILGFASKANICVDTHVHRISNRLGWVETKTPEDTEQALYMVIEPRWWPRLNLFFVTWGQKVCRPIGPRCGECVLATLCPKVGVRSSAVVRRPPQPSPAKAPRGE